VQRVCTHQQGRLNSFVTPDSAIARATFAIFRARRYSRRDSIENASIPLALVLIHGTATPENAEAARKDSGQGDVPGRG
jgi:hypothetical protein